MAREILQSRRGEVLAEEVSWRPESAAEESAGGVRKGTRQMSTGQASQ